MTAGVSKLSAKELQVVDFVRKRKKAGLITTYKDIGQHMTWTKNTVSSAVARIRIKGYDLEISERRVIPQERRDDGSMAPTPRQDFVLAFIVRFMAAHGGLSPVVREIMDHLNINSPNGVMCHLRALKAKGVIDWDTGKSRSIRLLIGKPCEHCKGLGRILPEGH